MATIITGKGSGIIRQAAASWLSSNSKLITGFFEIRDLTGGCGAYGIYIRPEAFNRYPQSHPLFDRA
jgi:DNA-nicking Smr family endonuclease